MEFDGSKNNNIILDIEMLKKFEFTNFDNFLVFYDDNPTCPENERYKMIANRIGHRALVALVSADGIRWDSLKIITDIWRKYEIYRKQGRIKAV